MESAVPWPSLTAPIEPKRRPATATLSARTTSLIDLIPVPRSRGVAIGLSYVNYPRGRHCRGRAAAACVATPL
jgi:hypothetical protein